MGFCNNCGEKIDPGVEFCENCGAMVDEQPVSQSPQPSARQEPHVSPPSPCKTSPIPRIYIAAGIVVIVIIIAVILASGVMSRPPNTVVTPTISVSPTSTSSGSSSSGISQVVLEGDIDNLGFGWPNGFDVFSGQKTPSHTWPFFPEKDDAPGTDRILVGSGLNTGVKGYTQDGYTRDSQRPDNIPAPITLSYTPLGKKVASAQLQIFLDDFQPVALKSRFIVTLNGRRANFVENSVNILYQTGPSGRSLTV